MTPGCDIVRAVIVLGTLALSAQVTRADALPEAYKRYLVNSLREAFEMPGTPIRLALREKENPFKGRAKFKH